MLLYISSQFIISGVMLVAWNWPGVRLFTSQIDKTELDLSVYWLSRLKKVMEKMLMMQIQLRSMLFVAVTVWIAQKNKKIKETFLQYLKTSIRISKVVHVIDRRSEHFHICFACFTFILLININKNINQHSYWNYTKGAGC